MTFNAIFETLSSDLDDDCPTEEQVRDSVDDLCEGKYLVERPCDDDSVIYEARPGLQWPDFVDLSDPVKKQILLYLVDNPKAFFVLYSTQLGKSKISSSEMKKWSEAENVKVVSVVIVDNSLNLAGQSSDGFLKTFPNVFTLSSNAKSSNAKTKIEDDVLTYVSAYGSDEYDEYKMPVIVALQNDAQISRVVEILRKIQDRANHATKPSKLRYGILFDEADKTYPPIRHRLLPFIRDPVALHRVGFITATEGELLDDYEECCNAQMYKPEVDPEDKANYRSIQTAESVIHRVELGSKKQKPNDYAEMIIRNNPEHFNAPIALPSGEVYYRKTIVNGNTGVRDMEKFARDRVAEGNYAMTFNQNGITLYTADGTKRYKLGNRKILRETIMCIYKSRNLNDKPLFIIGRRKVDRGLGFHFAPRDAKDIQLEFEEGPIMLRGGEGLIFTDLILGHVEDKSTATQKSGREDGIVAQCPQYPGALHYWTDERTARLVVHHNQMVDAANALPGAYSTLQATTRAREQVAAPEAASSSKPKPKAKHNGEIYKTIKSAKEWCDNNCAYEYTTKNKKGETVTKKYRSTVCHPHKLKGDGELDLEDKSKPRSDTHTHISYGGEPRAIEDNVEAVLGWNNIESGVNDGARIVPVRNGNGGFDYIVIHKEHETRINV